MARQGRLTGAGSRLRRENALSGRDGNPSEGPFRTCVGCRKHGRRSDLLRTVLVSDGSVVRLDCDENRRKPGRGAWLHPVADCLNLAMRRTAFPRALKYQGALDLSDVATLIGALEAQRRD